MINVHPDVWLSILVGGQGYIYFISCKNHLSEPNITLFFSFVSLVKLILMCSICYVPHAEEKGEGKEVEREENIFTAI